MGIGITIDVQDGLSATLRGLKAKGADLAPAMAEIAETLLASTITRFEAEMSPAGVPWKKSLRAAEGENARTLFKSGDLFNSLDQSHSSNEAVIGVIPVGGVAEYAAIHQFGGTIRPKTERSDGKPLSKALNTPFGYRASVTIPARPYLGISDDDEADVYNIIYRHFSSLVFDQGKGAAA